MKDLKEHIANGCNYGQADGPDDNITECECIEFPNFSASLERMGAIKESITELRKELEKMQKENDER